MLHKTIDLRLNTYPVLPTPPHTHTQHTHTTHTQHTHTTHTHNTHTTHTHNTHTQHTHKHTQHTHTTHTVSHHFCAPPYEAKCESFSRVITYMGWLTWWIHMCGLTYLVGSHVWVDLLGGFMCRFTYLVGSYVWFDLFGGVLCMG